MTTYDGVDTFVPGIGTVRECIDCGALISGGPTRCVQCTKTWVRVANRVERAISGAWWGFYWRHRIVRDALRWVTREKAIAADDSNASTKGAR